ncbi:hypothetical protein [Halobellus litoreus]|uniref:PGF-CTERM protein n=1 Tax=Halobellus litoreus TaxID=755310 RepID=A0ABD6DVR3_9EURY|nr:hypothetical protein [Halobellus litoreus]
MSKLIANLILCLLVVTAAVPTGVIAQESTPENEEPEEEPTEYELVISDSLRVIDAKWVGEKTFVARVEADRAGATITIVDAGRSSDGTFVDLRPQTYDISRDGVTEIRYTVAEDRAVTLNADGGVWLFADDSGGVDVLPEGDWTLVALLVSSVMAFFLILVFALLIGTLRKNKTETLA